MFISYSKCDMCKDELPDGLFPFFAKVIRQTFILEHDIFEDRGSRRFDLCKSCSQKLLNFLNNKK